MNDDPTAASDSARLPLARDDIDIDNESDVGSQDEADLQGQVPSGEGANHQHSQSDRRARRARNAKRRAASQVRRAKAGIAKKLEFFTHLMSSLDVVVFAELCVLYYMEYAHQFPIPSRSKRKWPDTMLTPNSPTAVPLPDSPFARSCSICT